MREQQDRLLGVIDALVGEVGLVVGDERDGVLAGDVAGGDDRDLVPGDAGAEADAADPPRGDGLRTVTPCSMPGSVRSST